MVGPGEGDVVKPGNNLIKTTYDISLLVPSSFAVLS